MLDVNMVYIGYVLVCRMPGFTSHHWCLPEIYRKYIVEWDHLHPRLKAQYLEVWVGIKMQEPGQSQGGVYNTLQEKLQGIQHLLANAPQGETREDKVDREARANMAIFEITARYPREWNEFHNAWWCKAPKYHLTRKIAESCGVDVGVWDLYPGEDPLP
jgi:hypothetical protein